WRLAWVKFLEQTDDPSAAAAWVTLGDNQAFKANLNVQRQALAAPSTQNDSAFLSRTIERIRAISGDRSMSWKLAQARLQLREPAGANIAELIKSLSEIAKTNPTNIDARALLAAAYEKSGNLPAAIGQLTEAAKLHPDSRT